MHIYLYDQYLGKDKPFRHYLQHLFVAGIGLIILINMFNIPLTATNVVIFLLSSYIVDIDGLTSVFIFRNKIPEAGLITDALLSGKLHQTMILATIHHKKLNHLVLHNIIALIILIVTFFFLSYTKHLLLILISGAILFHFVLDIIDDLFQLGHLQNWLWPLKIMRLID